MSVTYMTRQQKAVLACIESFHGGASATELAELLHAQGQSIGLTTVYRQLEKLQEQGLVATTFQSPASQLQSAGGGVSDHGASYR